MAQITIYLDGKTSKLAAREAKKKHLSLSRWVKDCIVKEADPAWPEAFKKTYGSLSGGDFERPSQEPTKDKRILF